MITKKFDIDSEWTQLKVRLTPAKKAEAKNQARKCGMIFGDWVALLISQELKRAELSDRQQIFLTQTAKEELP